MFLSELLFKYENNNNLQLFLKSISDKANMYLEIINYEDDYKIISTEFFNAIFHSTSTIILLDEEVFLIIQSFLLYLLRILHY